MKKVLILGGSYFIGKRLVEIIDKKEYEISVLNRATKENQNSNKYEHIKADRNDRESLQKLKGKKYDIVFDISGLEKNQVKNTIDIVEPKNIGLYVFLSSSAVYSDKEKRPFSETTLLGGNSVWGAYGENKIDCENYVQSIHKKSGMPFTIVRPPYVYGKWNYVYRESYCFERIDDNRPIILPGDGRKKIQFISVDDLCYTMIKIAEAEYAHNNIYNVGKEILTFEQWAKLCMESINKTTDIVFCNYEKHNMTPRDFFPFYDYENILDASKINNIYTPKTNMKEELANCYEWYLKNKEYIKRRDYDENEKIILKNIKKS